MPATVVLKDIVEALELQFDEAASFLDLDSGQVETVSVELLGKAEDGDEPEPNLPDWQEQEWEVAKRIVSTDRFLSLPSKFDVNEWEIMESFSHSVESTRIREELLRAIHANGAFRYFKDTVRRHRIGEAWYGFRTDALRKIAIEWCEEHHLQWG